MTKTTKRAPAPKAAKPRKAKPAGTAKPSRHAKPRTRKPARKPEIARRKLVWRGALIAIQYKPEALAHSAHLELSVIAPDRIPIPVTETGHRSHFVDATAVEMAGGPVAFVRKWLEREAGSKAYLRALDRWRQLDLFG